MGCFQLEGTAAQARSGRLHEHLEPDAVKERRQNFWQPLRFVGAKGREVGVD